MAYRVELADSIRTGYRLWTSFCYQEMAHAVARRECNSGIIAPLWRVVAPNNVITWAGRSNV